MNHSRQIVRSRPTLLLSFIAAFIVCTISHPVLADNERMAGARPSSSAAAQKSAPNGDKPVKDVKTTLDVNFKHLESIGYYPAGDGRSLGIDVWAGTKRSDLLTYLSASYSNLSYRSLLLLLKNALLTTADTSMINNDEQAKAGSDLTTLRIEKLMELGFYEEAAAIYAKNSNEPYHERYARAGVLALLYSQQMPLACIETKIVFNRFSDVSFWQQMEKICSVILLKNVPKDQHPDNGDVAFESKVLKKLASGSSYKLKVKSTGDLKNLTPLTIAVLHAMDRIDVSAFNFKDTGTLPHHVISLLLDNDTMSDEGRFRLMVESAQRGMISPKVLEEYYMDAAEQIVGDSKTSLKEYESIQGWKRLPYLYNASGNVARGEEQRVILTKAIALEKDYGNASLWPFHDVFTALPADSLSDSLIRAGLRVFTATATPIPGDWADKWLGMHKNLPVAYDDLDIVDYTYLLNTDIDLSKVIKTVEKQKDSVELLPHKQHLTNIIYEKLDKERKLHNYVPSHIYEKDEGLTPTDDYVMPVSGLLERLAQSNKDKRLGEIVLLSSILLAPMKPGEIHGDILEQVLDSLLTVGLTKEAQNLANQVLLGFE